MQKQGRKDKNKFSKVNQKAILTLIAMLSLTPTLVSAANPIDKETPVTYSGLGQQVYELSVPSLLKPGNTGEVRLWGTWDSNTILDVKTNPTITLTNSIDKKTKELQIEFNNISLIGDNTELVEEAQKIKVEDITDALFGEWTGTIVYSIAPHTHEWEEDYTVDVVSTCKVQGTKSIHCKSSSCTEVKEVTTMPLGECINDNGVCTECNQYIPGLYNASGELICTWEESEIDSTCSNAKTVINNTYTTTTKVIIPYGVTSIGQSAFNNCRNIKKVVIPDGVKSIGNYAFINCFNIKSMGPVGSGADLEIPDSVTSFGTEVFQCAGLVWAIIPNGVTNISTRIFYSATNLKYVYIHKNVVTLPGKDPVYSMFYGCTLRPTVYCETNSKPSGWAAYFRSYTNSGSNTPTYFNKTLDEFKTLAGIK